MLPSLALVVRAIWYSAELRRDAMLDNWAGLVGVRKIIHVGPKKLKPRIARVTRMREGVGIPPWRKSFRGGGAPPPAVGCCCLRVGGNPPSCSKFRGSIGNEDEDDNEFTRHLFQTAAVKIKRRRSEDRRRGLAFVTAGDASESRSGQGWHSLVQRQRQPQLDGSKGNK